MTGDVSSLQRLRCWLSTPVVEFAVPRIFGARHFQCGFSRQLQVSITLRIALRSPWELIFDVVSLARLYFFDPRLRLLDRECWISQFSSMRRFKFGTFGGVMFGQVHQSFFCCLVPRQPANGEKMTTVAHDVGH